MTTWLVISIEYGYDISQWGGKASILIKDV